MTERICCTGGGELGPHCENCVQTAELECLVNGHLTARTIAEQTGAPVVSPRPDFCYRCGAEVA